MKKIILFLLCLVFFSFFANAQWNPYVNQGIIAPAPLLPVEFAGAGEASFNVGNTGGSPLTVDPVVPTNNMTMVITLSDGVPNNADPIAALGGEYKNKFSWTYDASIKTYTATQIETIGGGQAGQITIQYLVANNTPSGVASNGFNVNLQPPPYANNSNSTNDDAVSSYTFTAAYDFGDAPVSYGQARNQINTFKDMNINSDYYNTYVDYIFLGSSVDQESDYQASTQADGDDTNGADDENGVTFPVMIPGNTVTIPVVVTTVENSTGRLSAWIDWNGDGDFLDFASTPAVNGERIAHNIDFLGNGDGTTLTETYNITVTVPSNAVTSVPTYARFRVGPGNMNPVSTSYTKGEVEDYMITIQGQFPLTLIKFEALWKEGNENVEINWETTSEINLEKFILERRSESETEFKEISRIVAKGTMDINKYNFNDKDIKRGMRYYYKLRPIDNDGQENKNAIDEVLIPGQKMEVMVYPNPANSVMNIEVFGKSNERLNIELHDYTGKNALKNIVIEKSSNSTEKASIDVSKLPQGLYFIKVFSDTEVNVKSVTIIK